MRQVNQTARTRYTLAELNELEQGEIDACLMYRNALTERLTRALKRPDAQKNPDRALLAEIIGQLL